MNNWDLIKYPFLKKIIELSQDKSHFVQDIVKRDDVESFKCLLGDQDLYYFIERYKYRMILLKIKIAKFLGRDYSKKICDLNKNLNPYFDKDVLEYISTNIE